jgi:hypothetical protein
MEHLEWRLTSRHGATQCRTTTARKTLLGRVTVTGKHTGTLYRDATWKTKVPDTDRSDTEHTVYT